MGQLRRDLVRDTEPQGAKSKASCCPIQVRAARGAHKDDLRWASEWQNILIVCYAAIDVVICVSLEPAGILRMSMLVATGGDAW